MILVWVAIAVEALGILFALTAIYRVRTPQGTVAWVMALLTIPAVSVPAFLLFGRRRFHGYVLARRRQLKEMGVEARAAAARYEALGLLAPPKTPEERALAGIARLPFTTGNDAELLIDGEATFRSMFDGIERARHYVLVQFYILVDDKVGRELRDRLIAQARSGVRVHVLYDEVGSTKLPGTYVSALRDGGVAVAPFNTKRGRSNRFQLNFRNHRKLVVVDGTEAWLGGLNVGVEYLGEDPRFGAWRDTHLRVRGPVVSALQVAFLEDWHWASNEGLALAWEAPAAATPGLRMLALPTGPADENETGSLLVVALANAATSRLWLASPYFVPDSAVLSALTLAALRGVDVRIRPPASPDHRLVWLARFAHVSPCERTGIRLLEYTKGFLHEKVIVVDDRLATIGTMNLDNRSLRLNFELTLLVDDAGFAARTAAMLARDMDGARPLTSASLAERGFFFGLGVRVANLFAPIL